MTDGRRERYCAILDIHKMRLTFKRPGSCLNLRTWFIKKTLFEETKIQLGQKMAFCGKYERVLLSP